MRVEFYINDKKDINELLNELAISLTLKMYGVVSIWIDDEEYNLQEVREKLYKRGLPDIK